MICDMCSGWAAKTERVLALRMANIVANPHVRTHRCPHCQGTDWATTDLYLMPRDLEQEDRVDRMITRLVVYGLLVVTIISAFVLTRW